MVDVLAAGVRSDLLSVLPRNRPDQKKNVRTPDTIRLSISPGGDTVHDSADRGAVRAVQVVSARQVSSMVKVAYDAPDPGAVIPAQEASGCAARA